MKIPRSIRRLWYKPWKREIKFLIQKIRRGWHDGDTFSLDYTLSKLIVCRLKRFKELNICHPVELSEKEWSDMLDKMIASFEFGASENRWNATHEEYEKHQEGLELFAKHFWQLWW